MQTVIMAGGKGTRLKNLTVETPKPMLRINGKPILQHQIENLKADGLTDITIVIGYLGEQIKDYFKDGRRFGVRIGYVEENVPLGTAGAFYYLRDIIKNDFVLLYGDVMLSVDFHRFASFAQEKKGCVALFVHPNSHPLDSDLLEVDSEGRLLRFLSKIEPRGDYHNLANAGVYICKKKLLEYVPEPVKLDFEKDLLFSRLLDKGIYAYRSSEYVKDAGTFERLKRVAEDDRLGIIASRNLKFFQKCIFLDRDGVVNIYRGFISRPEEIALEAGVIEALRKINASDYLCILLSNQPVVARGECSLEEVGRIHKRLETLLGNEGVYFDDILFCPHHPDRGYEGERPEYKIECDCRKPRTGMVDVCAARYHLDLSRSFIVGDTTVDIQTGINAGMKTILVKTGLAGQDNKFVVRPDKICKSLLEAAQSILG